MRAEPLLSLLLSILFLAQPGHCFLPDIGAAISNGIKSAWNSFVDFIVTSITNTVTWAAQTIRETAESMATDMFAALSAAGEGVRNSANKTLSEILDQTRIQVSQQLLKMMHTGPLPEEYYFRKIVLTEEIHFLDDVVEIISIMTYLCLGVLSFCNLIIFVLFCCYCLTKKELLRVDELEEAMTKKLGEEELKRKELKYAEAKDKAEKIKSYREIMAVGSGPIGFAGRPPRGMY